MSPTLFDAHPTAINHTATYRCTSPRCPNRATLYLEHYEPPRCHNNHPSRTMTKETAR